MKTRILTHSFVAFLLFFASLSLSQGQTTRYVKPTATGTGDGSTWTDASGDLQAMITASAATDQVWVAAGTYKPTTTTNRAISFSMKNDVAIYGGFAGNETDLSQRPVVNPVSGNPSSTTLSGDIGAGASTDNSYHVISNPPGLTTSAVLDGFVITGGNANGSSTGSNLGGGMYNNGSSGSSCSPAVCNCSFEKNVAFNGGGIYNDGRSSGNSSPMLTSCSFQSNSVSNYGGAMLTSGTGAGTSTPVLTNCLFLANSAGFGGAIFNDGTNTDHSNSKLTNCLFQRNSASSLGGGAIFNNFESITTAVNCSFQDNSTIGNGGAFYGGVSILTNCSLLANSATNGGGFLGGSPVLTNCAVFNNGGSSTFFGSNASATYTLFDACVTGYSGSNNLTTTTSPFASTTGTRLASASPAIDAGNNSAYQTANGPATDLAGTPRIYSAGGTGMPDRIDMGAYEFGSGLTLATQASPTLVCAGNTVALSVTASGGTSEMPDHPYSYTWSAPVGITLSSTSTSAVSASVGVGVSGVQTFVNAASTVLATYILFDASVTVNAPPTNASLTSGTLTCAMTSLTLTASATDGTRSATARVTARVCL